MEDLERLLGRHTEAEVIAWARRLRHFHFMGEMSSGQMEVREELQLRLDFEGREDLLRVLDALGLRRAAAAGQDGIPEHPDLLQPGHCRVAGVDCYVSVGSGFVDVICACFAEGRIREAEIQAAGRIEAAIDALGWQARVNRSIATHFNCVSAANYPERFR